MAFFGEDATVSNLRYGSTVAAERVLIASGFVIVDDRQTVGPLIMRLGRESQPETLAPRAKDDGARWSHSDHHGFGGFPWHTDGAVSTLPPRWMVLECEVSEGPTETHLLDPSAEVILRMRRSVMRVRNQAGRVRYLPAASPSGDGGLRLRWDPRVCEASDATLAETIADQPPTGVCEWSPGRVLVVDNWRMLHRRPPVDPASLRRLIRTYVRPM